MTAPRIVLRDRQTSLADCIEVIEADAAIVVENAQAEGKDPDAAALAYTRAALHAIADSLIIADGEPPAKPAKKAKKAANGRRRRSSS